jgi:hypothetical protein
MIAAGAVEQAHAQCNDLASELPLPIRGTKMKNIIKAAIYVILAIMCIAPLISVAQWVYVTCGILCYLVLAALMFKDR